MPIMETHYSLILAGTGPASMFFLQRFLENADKRARVLVLERGALHDHRWHIDNRATQLKRHYDSFHNATPKKNWIYNIDYGGSSNCWVGNTPRMLPNDFLTKTRYGIAEDWPLNYDQLEPYYTQAEAIMQISGDRERSPYRLSQPYPQPPHRMGAVEARLAKAFPDSFFPIPNARARRATSQRTACCASSVCWNCPVDAKFTVLNGFRHLLSDERVTFVFQAPVSTLDYQGNQISGVTYSKEGVDYRVTGDLVALGMNGIFNPYIMLKSGMAHPALGRYLSEQVSVTVNVQLDNLANIGASTAATGCSYLYYDGQHRKERAACLGYLGSNTLLNFRMERGKWTHVAGFRLTFEDIPLADNRVEIGDEGSDKPVTRFQGHSDYAHRAMATSQSMVENLTRSLPVEAIHVIPEHSRTEAHIQGTTRMGHDPETSVIDRNLRHHRYRNLVVLGSGCFPNCPPANPTLTISALSLWAADNL